MFLYHSNYNIEYMGSFIVKYPSDYNNLLRYDMFLYYHNNE